jgi:hypothetical protein
MARRDFERAKKTNWKWNDGGFALVWGQGTTAEAWEMKIEISAGAEADVADGYWFYERQNIGLGD